MQFIVLIIAENQNGIFYTIEKTKEKNKWKHQESNQHGKEME